MSTSILRVVFSVVLLAAAALSWAAAGVAEDLSSRHERLATFADAEPPSSGRWRAAVEAVIDPDALARSAAMYWRGDYAALAAGERREADDLMIAANGLFRQAQTHAGSGPLSVEQLDRALQAYGAVLKNAGFSREAAYNYEFVARLRDTMAQRKPSRQPLPRAEPAPADDLPAGPTVHGHPGTHPPNTRGEEFEVLTPMDYGEREAQPEPTPGRPLRRKG